VLAEGVALGAVPALGVAGVVELMGTATGAVEGCTGFGSGAAIVGRAAPDDPA
jgi:hypothetical protein